MDTLWLYKSFSLPSQSRSVRQRRCPSVLFVCLSVRLQRHLQRALLHAAGAYRIGHPGRHDSFIKCNLGAVLLNDRIVASVTYSTLRYWDDFSVCLSLCNARELSKHRTFCGIYVRTLVGLVSGSVIVSTTARKYSQPFFSHVLLWRHWRVWKNVIFDQYLALSRNDTRHGHSYSEILTGIRMLSI